MPKYLSHLNEHKVPTYAMWTDLALNLVLLLMSDYVFVLAVSNCNYMIFNFLNLNAGWIHRIDNPRVPRPFKAPRPCSSSVSRSRISTRSCSARAPTPGARARSSPDGSAP
jgi:amino acid transporter